MRDIEDWVPNYHERLGWALLLMSGEHSYSGVMMLSQLLTFTEVAVLWRADVVCPWLKFGLTPEQIAGRARSGISFDFFDAIDHG